MTEGRPEPVPFDDGLDPEHPPPDEPLFPASLDRAEFAARQALRSLLPAPVGTPNEDAVLVRAVRETGVEPGLDNEANVWSELAAHLPDLRHATRLDVRAAHDGDPACRHPEEAALCYPGVHAITGHRLAHWLWNRGCVRTARLIAETVHARTAIDIHPGAALGTSVFIDHGNGVVIGETSVVGSFVKIYQGVTLGAVSTDRATVGTAKRHPTLEDHVTVYANATILGGDTVVGAGSVIGAGVLITSSVPPRHLAVNPKPKIELRPNRAELPISFDI